MSNEDIRRKIAELSEIATQLRINKSGNREPVDQQIKHLIEEILFLNKEPGCSEAVEAIQSNIAFFYMGCADELKLAESIENLVEKLKTLRKDNATMENTNAKRTIDFNSMYLDLQCAAWQLENPTSSYEVNAAITSIMERMSELQGDQQYGHYANTILRSVKKRLNGEIPQTELAKHVQMIAELIGYGEGYLPTPTAASEAIKKVQDKAKEAYTKAAEAVPEDLTERLKNGAMGAYEHVSAVVSESAKEKGRQLMDNVKDMLKNVVNGGSGDSTGEK